MRRLTARLNSAIATPFRYWQETGGYKDVLRLCNAVVADNHSIDSSVLETVPAPVKNFASYFVQKFIDSSLFLPFLPSFHRPFLSRGSFPTNPT